MAAAALLHLVLAVLVGKRVVVATVWLHLKLAVLAGKRVVAATVWLHLKLVVLSGNWQGLVVGVSSQKKYTFFSQTCPVFYRLNLQYMGGKKEYI